MKFEREMRRLETTAELSEREKLFYEKLLNLIFGNASEEKYIIVGIDKRVEMWKALRTLPVKSQAIVWDLWYFDLTKNRTAFKHLLTKKGLEQEIARILRLLRRPGCITKPNKKV